MTSRAKSFKRSRILKVDKIYIGDIHIGSNITELPELDVALPSDNQLLYYNTTSNAFVNTTNPLTEPSLKIGVEAGQCNQSTEHAIAIGYRAGRCNQEINSIAIGGQQTGTDVAKDYTTFIGTYAGNRNSREYSIAVGDSAGCNSNGYCSVCIGVGAGLEYLGSNCIAIGDFAVGNGISFDIKSYNIGIGYYTCSATQEDNLIAIGKSAGENNQCNNSIAIGCEAGYQTLGSYSISIGYRASYESILCNNYIVINSSNGELESIHNDSTFINPIQNNDSSFNLISITPLYYNQTSKELITTNRNIGSLNIIPQNTDPISANNCYGGCIYSTTNGGTLTLPAALEGMHFYHISAMNPVGSITLTPDGGETINGGGSYTFDNNPGSGKPRIHLISCPQDGIWITNTTI